MQDQEILIPCSACGQAQPRTEMFGAAPDLLCQRCRDGLSRRMNVRFRPLARERKPIVTYAMIGIAAGLYVLEHFVFASKMIGPGIWPTWWETVYLNLHMGPRIWDGQVWPLLGSAFLHGGFIHIFFNAWWILSLGKATESGFGHRTLVLLVIGSALVSGGAEWMISGPGVGLSGVVYALAFFLWVHHKTNAFAAAIMNQRTINFLSMWFVLCIVMTMTGTWSIANWAHGMGALFGWLTGQATLRSNRRVLVPLAIVGTIAFTVCLVFIAFGVQRSLRAADREIKGAETQMVRYVYYLNGWAKTRMKP